MLPVSVFATDDNLKETLGITTESIAVTGISEESDTYKQLSKAAQDRYWGLYVENPDIGDLHFGRIHSACHITSSVSSAPEYVEITMNTPEQSDSYEFSDSTTGWAVLALVDGKLVTYPTTEDTTENKLTFSVRLGEEGTDLALACLSDAKDLASLSSAVGDWGTLTLTAGGVEQVESLGYVRPYTLTLDISEGIATYLQSEYFLHNFDLTFSLNSVGLKIDAESVSFEENELFQLNPEQTGKVSEGCYKFTAQVDLNAWKNKNFANTVGISYAAPNAEPLLFEGEVQVSLPPPNHWASMIACVPLAITVVKPPEDVTYHKITVTQGENGTISPRGVEGEVWVKDNEDMTFTITPDEGYEVTDVIVDGKSVGAVDTYTFKNVTTNNHTITATFQEPLPIKPVDLTKYVTAGGDDDNYYPEPRYEGIPANAEITYGNGNTQVTWDVTEQGGYPFTIQYYVRNDDGTDTLAEGDLEPGTYIAKIESANSVRLNSVRINGRSLKAEEGLLHVVAVSHAADLDSEHINQIASQVTTTPPTSPADLKGNALAVMPADMTYLVNNINGQTPSQNMDIRLLHDELLSNPDNQDEDTYVQMLIDRLENPSEDEATPLVEKNANRRYAMKYLDLIDANDSNILVTAQGDYDIYIPYPAGTDQNTEFQLFRFNNLTRTYADEVDYGDGVENAIRTTRVTVMKPETTEAGIKVHIAKAPDSLDNNPVTIGAMALTWVAADTSNPGGTTRYTITASAGEGGQISPSGKVQVVRGSDKTFTITPAEGYVISDVLVDGQSVGALTSYTFQKVTANHTIQAVFAPASQVADPDDTGVSDWLNTADHAPYLFGYPEGTFRPDSNMTRAEAAQMFYNLLLNKSIPVTVRFEDVADGSWYATAVNALASIGVIQGVGENRFAPDQAITRAEFTAMAMRFAKLDTGGKNLFSDVSPADWFYDYVVGSIQYGWINGYEDGTFRPNHAITRAEVTTITNCMLGRSGDTAYVNTHLDALRQFPDTTQRHWAYYNIMEATNAHDYEKSGGAERWTGLTPQ